MAASSRGGEREDAWPPKSRWEWPVEEIRRIGYRTVDLIAEHLTDLPRRPVFRPFPPDLASKYLSSPPPESGEDADDVLTTFAREIEPYPFGNGHPRFYGWVNSPPAVLAIFAEALAAAMNPSCAGGNHAATYVEHAVINWFKRIVGFPADSAGLLVSGGSIAALTSLAAARHARCKFDVRAKGLQENASRLRVYGSAEGHGCHQKAIELLGIGSENLRTIPHDRALRMAPDMLHSAIGEDLRRGFTPMAVIASAGTVNTGAIDPLDEIADVCAEHGVWLHVDAAYGGPAILSCTYAAQLSALSRADSLALDPHKWLCIPVEAGLVLVRDAAGLRATFSLVPPYLQTGGKADGVGGLPWLSEYGIQQTRGFRALKVWMALRYHGLSGYRESIEHAITLAELLATLLNRAGDFEVFEPQSLSVVCFRYAPPPLDQDGGRADEVNRAVLERVQLGGDAFVSSTTIEGRFWLRACIINPRADAADIQALVEVVANAGHSIIAM